jgi:Flp pilus assembly protein TadG
MTRPADSGQASVELVLVLPLLLTLGLVLVQAAAVLRDQLAVVHAAREAARAASVDGDPAAARDAAWAVRPGASIHMEARPVPGRLLAVTVRYRSPTRMPVVGRLLPDPLLSARAVMRVEQ